MSFQIDKFKIKRGEEYLCKSDFDFWPAWSEHYDYDEIDDIASWGIDREWALSKFSEYDTGGPHPHYIFDDPTVRIASDQQSVGFTWSNS
jgi:hypothetical protein